MPAARALDAAAHIADQLASFALLGLLFAAFGFLLSRIRGERTNLVVQHRVFSPDQLREVLWPLLNPLLLAPLVALQSYWLVDRLLAPVVPRHPLAGWVEALPFAVQVLVGTMIVDFVTYWRHRFVHHFAWPYHTIHHAAHEIHWTTTTRLHPGDVFLMSLVRVPLMYVLGFDGPAMAVTEGIHTAMNLVDHLNLSLDWPGPLRYLLVSPNMHRWHHAADDPRAVNKNYCVIWAFWDVLFGTYYVPRDRLPTAYGVRNPDGTDVVGEGFLAQLAYPFVHHARWVRQRLAGGVERPSP